MTAPGSRREHLRHYSGFAKYTTPTSIGKLELTAHAYRGTWKPTEQIPDRIIGSAVCPDVFCSPDPSATGETTRFIADAKISNAGWRANVYAQYYDWTMYSNPTYANADGTSAQIKQFDKRWIVGMKGEKQWAADRRDRPQGRHREPLRLDQQGRRLQHRQARLRAVAGRL